MAGIGKGSPYIQKNSTQSEEMLPNQSGNVNKQSENWLFSCDSSASPQNDPAPNYGLCLFGTGQAVF